MLHMMSKIEQIVVIRKLDNDQSSKVVAMENTIKEFGHNNNIPVLQFNDALTSPTSLNIPTLIVSIGGDGTLLFAAKESLKFERAYVLGVNAGNLGFLTDTFGEHYLTKHLNDIVDVNLDKIKLDKRNIIYAEYSANNGSMQTALAMNEFFISASNNHAPINYEIKVNDQFLAEQNGSGIMVATATGSTAFALSSGGSIMHPTTSAMQIVPVNAHSLTARPVVLSGTRDVVEINVPVTPRIDGIDFHVDGQRELKFTHTPEPFNIRIKTYDKVVKIVRSTDWHFFETLSTKLGWK